MYDSITYVVWGVLLDGTGNVGDCASTAFPVFVVVEVGVALEPAQT